MGLLQRIDDMPKGAWIALTVVSFIVFWPIGLALLIYLKWSGRMSCWKQARWGHWSTPDGRQMGGRDARDSRDDFRQWRRHAKWMGRNSSGNVAFDEYREETLRKLEDDQREFQDYLDKLRAAKDRAEFDQFMADRRHNPAPPPAPQGNAPQA